MHIASINRIYSINNIHSICPPPSAGCRIAPGTKLLKRTPQYTQLQPPKFRKAP